MKLKIRTKLLLSFTLVLVLSSLVQAFTFNTTQDYSISQVRRNQLEQARTGVDALKDFFSRIDFYSRSLGRVFSTDTIDSTSELDSLTSLILKGDNNISQVAIFTPEGESLVNGDLEPRLSDYIDIAADGEIAVSNVYYQDGEPFVAVFSPAISNEGGVVGVIRIDARLSGLGNTISGIGLQDTDPEGVVYVVDRNGLLIIHPDKELANSGKDLSTRKLVSEVLKDTTERLTDGDYIYLNFKGDRVVANGLKAPGVEWSVFYEQPVSVAFSFINFVRILYFSTLTGAIILLMIMSALLSWNLTSSIKKLQQATHKLRKGKFDTKIYIKSGDEIEDLGESFNAMAKEIQRRSEIISADRNMLRTIISGIVDAIIAVDPNQKIILFNKVAENLTGYSEKEVLGKDVSSVIKLTEKGSLLEPSIYCPIRMDGFEGVLFKGKGLKLTGAKKNSKFVNVISGQIKEGKKVNLGCILTFHDVSAEEELERMKLDFVSMAAHQLRTPLTSILGYAELLEEEMRDKFDSQTKEYVDRMKVNIGSLNNLIDNLLEVSKIETGKKTSDIKPLDLTVAVERVVKEFQSQAKQKKQSLKYSASEKSIPKVLANKLRVEQVLSNLIINAITYTPERGKITVTVKKYSRGQVSVSVSDTGIGILKDLQDKLFTKFFRISSPLVAGTKGTGLGLYISKSIIGSLGGDMWVDSEPGKGSVFTFTLPIDRAAST